MHAVNSRVTTQSINGTGAFVLDEKAVIGTDTASRPAAALLSGWLKATTGRETKITGRGTISLKVNPALTKLGSEGCQD